MTRPSIFHLIALLFFIILLTISGLFWFDYLGLIHVRESFSGLFGLGGWNAPKDLPADDSLLDQQRLLKLKESLDEREQALDSREKNLQTQEAALTQRTTELGQKEKTLDQREKTLTEVEKQYENKEANLEQNATYLTGMPPARAVAILQKMEDQDIINILRAVDAKATKDGTQSVVGYWLSLFSDDRAATISRKMLSREKN